MSSPPVLPEVPVLASPSTSPVLVERWPSERPLFVAAVLTSAVLWVLLTVSLVGLAYAAILGGFFFVVHALFIAHVRGSGVRLGPDQLPELHARVQSIAARIGLERVPEVYLMQAGGALNALATRFLGAHFVVLFSDLLDACGDNEAARDMIIAHELGHVKAGHLRWHWLLLPSNLIPFLGTALSRAREYTCDRFGVAGAGEREGALLGLTILAAGGSHARRVNRDALVRQRADLNTGWMRIGEWLSTHPPLARRLAALDPALATAPHSSAAGTARALMILGAGVLLTGVLGWAAVKAVALAGGAAGGGAAAAELSPGAAQEVEVGFQQLAAFLSQEQAAGRGLPADIQELYQRWETAHPDVPAPVDPYDGQVFGYEPLGASYLLWSSGPDRAPGTEDDIPFDPSLAPGGPE